MVIKNLLKITLRNIKRYKIYSFINITGFAIGLSVSLILAFYVIDDLTYDHFHEKFDHIYRVITLEKSGGQELLTYSITAGPLLPAIRAELPEVLACARTKSYGRVSIAKGQVDSEKINETNSVRALSLVTDPGFLDIFSFKIIAGDQKSLLKAADGVLLTPESASAIFHNENPIGQTVTIRDLGYYVVTGLIESPPNNSHIQFGIIFPLRVEMNPAWEDSWENLLLSAYVLLAENAQQQLVEKKIIKVARAHNFADIYNPRLQSLADIHLGSADHRYDHRNLGKNDRTIVYSLLVIGIMILIIASINFINLSSSRATRRAKEVGMRKVAGSTRWQLVWQFLGESIVLTLIAMVIATGILQISLPHLDALIGKHLEIDYINDPVIPLILFGVAVFVGLISGIYPALVLSSFKPVNVLKGILYSGKSGALVRRLLVVFQFAISISLITSVLIVLQQIEFLKAREMGYRRDGVVAVRNPFDHRQREDLLANKISSIPSVLSVGRTNYLPGAIFLRIEVIPEGQSREQSRMYQRLLVDHGFINTLGISLSLGRGYSKKFSADRRESIIINETAVKLAGWKNPLGKRLDVVEIDGSLVSYRVIGVVKDFHYSNSRQAIEPMMFQLAPRGSPILLIRISGGRTSVVLKQIETIHRELYLDRPVNIFFLDDVFDRLFYSDREFASSIAIFSIIAIFIACMGLIGLVSYAIEQRRQEMAVRKVLGSSQWRIVFMLAVDFLKWVIYANIIAWPFSYFAMGLWVSEFVYIAPFSPLPYIIAGLGALIIALVTLLYQSVKAARANPVDSLKYE
jgi:putative ABC transport system permease protein